MSSYAPRRRHPKKKKEAERTSPKIQHIRSLAVKYAKENRLPVRAESFGDQIVAAVQYVPNLLTMNGRLLIEASLMVGELKGHRKERRERELISRIGRLSVPVEIGSGPDEEAKKRSDSYRASLLRYGFAIIESQSRPAQAR